MSEERVFSREEIKDLLTKEKTWIIHFDADWRERDFKGSNGQTKTYSWYVGNLMSNISKDFTRSNNDFLRQILSFESEARLSSGFEIKAGAAGSYKNSYSIEKKYRVMLNKILIGLD